MSNIDYSKSSNIQLSSLNVNEFERLNTLVELNLSYNKISIIPDKCFESLVNLKKLDLTSNKLSSLNGKEFDRLKLNMVSSFFD